MIGWHITPGYNSGFTGEVDWNVVKELAGKIAISVKLLDVAFTYSPEHLRGKVEEVYNTYHATAGNPLHVDDDEIMILASGGGEYRQAKAHVARAFVWLLLRAVHERGFDINIKTA